MEQVVFIYSKEQDIVEIQEADARRYTDTISNFVLDNGNGLDDDYDYNKTLRHCLINRELAEFPNAVAEECIANIDTLLAAKEKREYVPPMPPTLEEAKEAKLNELKAARDTAEIQPVTTDKGMFDVDEKSLTRINNAISVLQNTGSTLEWTLADNTVVEVTAEDLQNVILTLAEQSNTVHEKYRTLKAEVEACTTVEEVEKISWIN